MNTHRHTLLALDGSEASMRAVQHVAAALPPDGDARVRLLHIVGPIPTEMLEHGGSSDPETETRLGQELEEQQQAWIRKSCEEFQPVFEKAQARLVEAGLRSENVAMQCHERIPEDDLALLILDDARAAGCDEIVVGRGAYGWFVELFHRHIGEALEAMGDGIDVEIIP